MGFTLILIVQLSHIYFFANDSLLFFKVSHEECKRVCEVLRVYEEASSQKINLDKFEYMISRNISDNTGSEINKILGVKKVKSFGNYLGMLARNGRNKSQLFNRLRDRVWKALKVGTRNYFLLVEKRPSLNLLSKPSQFTP